MEKKLPEITLDGTVFYVDVAFAELREKGEPLNLISFFDMVNVGTHYELDYDRERKNVATSFTSKEHYVELKVPQMVDLDPQGVSRKYGMPVSMLPPRDKLLKCPEELLMKRLQGALPKVKLVNEEYYVDMRLKELRAVDNPHKRILLERQSMSPDGLKYLCFYHTGEKRVVEVSDMITELPKQVVLLAIPNEIWLDPIGTARQYTNDDRLLLDNYHFQYNLEARVFPLSQTGLPKIVERNLEQRNRSKNNKLEQRSTKKKRGRGL